MTSASQPTREELMQLALLEAYGLLDEYEEAEFGRLYRDASAADQDDIRELQSDVAADLTMLPDFEPPADLRTRVLANVTAAVDREAAPLARIGRSRAAAEEAGNKWTLRTATFWRAAVFVLCASLIVSMYYLADALRQSSNIAEMALSNLTEDQVKLAEALGPGLFDFAFDPNATDYKFTSTDGNSTQRGAIWVRQNQKKAFLRVEGLRPGSYALQVQDENGVMQRVATFNGVRAGGMHVDLERFALGPNPSWSIVDENGAEVLRSRTA